MLSTSRATIVRPDYHTRLSRVITEYTTPEYRHSSLFRNCENLLQGNECQLSIIFFSYCGPDLNAMVDFNRAVMQALFHPNCFKPLFDATQESKLKVWETYCSIFSLTYAQLLRKDVVQIIRNNANKGNAAEILKKFFNQTHNCNLDMLILLLKDIPLNDTLSVSLDNRSSFLLETWSCFQDIITYADLANIREAAGKHIPGIIVSQLQHIPKNIRPHIFTHFCQAARDQEFAQMSVILKKELYTELVNTFYPLIPRFRPCDKTKSIVRDLDNGWPFSFEIVLIILKHFSTPMPYVIRKKLVEGLKQHIDAITCKYPDSYRNATRKFLPTQAPTSTLFQPAKVVKTITATPSPIILATTSTSNETPITPTTKKKRRRKSRPQPTYEPEQVVTLSNRFSLLM